MEREEKSKKRDKKKPILKVILIIFTAMFVVFAATTGYVFSKLNKMKTTDISKTNEDLGIDPNKIEEVKPAEKITNIALFGVDSGRSAGDVPRSDSIMILSIDEKHKKLKISSIMRDSYVSVDGHGKTKITHAYAFGGPQLAIKTLNQNFDLDIRDYVTVDFAGMGDIIDALGGIEIDVKKSEISEVNKYMREVAKIRKKKAKNITKPGLQLLDGNQAVSYARIRHVGNGDYERAERQNAVLTAMFNKVQSQGTAKYPQLISEFLPYVETSMTKTDILKMGTDVVTSGITNLDWLRFPMDGYNKGKTIDDVWYLTFDEAATIDQMHKFIYDDIKPDAKTNQ